MTNTQNYNQIMRPTQRDHELMSRLSWYGPHLAWLGYDNIEYEPKRADLSKLVLDDEDFRGGCFRGIDFTETSLCRTDLRGVDFRGTNLYKSDLSESILYDTDLRGCVFPLVNLYGADLRNSNLRETIFYGSSLAGTHLDGTDLWGAILYGTSLSGAHLNNTKGISTFGPICSLGVNYIVAGNPSLVYFGDFVGTLEETEQHIRKEYSKQSADLYISTIRALLSILEL